METLLKPVLHQKDAALSLIKHRKIYRPIIPILMKRWIQLLINTVRRAPPPLAAVAVPVAATVVPVPPVAVPAAPVAIPAARAMVVVGTARMAKRRLCKVVKLVGLRDNDVDDADEEDPDFNDEPEAPPACAKNVVCFYFVQCSHLYLPLLRQSRVITTPDLQTLRTALSKAKTSAFLGFETGSQGSGSGMLSSCYLQCVPTDQNISYLNQSVLMNQDLRVSRR